MLLKLHNFILYLFVLLIMVDPTNLIFNAKEVVFVVLMLTTFITKKYYMNNSILKFVLVIWAFAFISVITGLLLYNSQLTATQSYFKTLLLLFVFLPLSGLSIDEIFKLNYRISAFLGCLIVVLYIAMTINWIPFGVLYYWSESKNWTIIISHRDYFGIEVTQFFYKSMPFILLGLAYSLYLKKVIPSLIMIAAIFIGMTRTPILCCLALIAYAFYKARHYRWLRFGLAFLITYLTIWLFSELTSKRNTLEGDNIKYTTLNDLLSSTDIFGHGVGAEFYSKERGGFRTNTEMSYAELLYQYGYLFGIPLIIYLFYPSIKMLLMDNRLYKFLGFSLLMYLVIAGTNPLLMNSTGIYTLICGFVILEKYNSKYDRNIISNL